MILSQVSVPILLHVVGAPPTWALAPLPAVGKAGSGNIRNKSRPDFIGISPSGFHVFESKGRSLQAKNTTKSSTVASACMKNALAQVSRISTVNGQPPITRTASVWVLQPGKTNGYITDPPSEPESYDLRFDLRQALLNYYRVALDAPQISPEMDSIRFHRFSLGAKTDLFFEHKLLTILQNLEKGEAEALELLKYLDERSRHYVRIRALARMMPSLSFGLDGIGLISSGNLEDLQKG